MRTWETPRGQGGRRRYRRQRVADRLSEAGQEGWTTFSTSPRKARPISGRRASWQDEKYRVVIFGTLTSQVRAPRLGRRVSQHRNLGGSGVSRKAPTLGTDDAQALRNSKLSFVISSANNVGRLRRQIPTYARVELATDDSVDDRGAFFFDGKEKPEVPLDTPGILARLQPGD